MTLNVIFYGRLADSAAEEIAFELDTPMTVAALRLYLADAFPQIRNDLTSSRVLFCVDDMLVTDDFAISPGARVEILSPLSGG